MKLSRRAALLGAGSIPLLNNVAIGAPTAVTLPAKAEFARMKGTYLDSGSQHPLPLGAQKIGADLFRDQDSRRVGAGIRIGRQAQDGDRAFLPS